MGLAPAPGEETEAKSPQRPLNVILSSDRCSECPPGCLGHTAKTPGITPRTGMTHPTGAPAASLSTKGERLLEAGLCHSVTHLERTAIGTRLKDNVLCLRWDGSEE